MRTFSSAYQARTLWRLPMGRLTFDSLPTFLMAALVVRCATAIADYG